MSKRNKIFVLLGSIVLVALFLVVYSTIMKNKHMLITSPAFENGALIPKKYTCDDGSINPQLFIQNVPDAAKSLALILDDSDAPHGNFTHWLLWNIDPKTAEIKQESIPPGSSEGTNDAERMGYIGPCPPSGTHHYHFKLYALDSMLDLPEKTTKGDLEKAIDGRVLEKAELIGLYARFK